MQTGALPGSVNHCHKRYLTGTTVIGYRSKIDGSVDLCAQRLITVGVEQGNNLSASVFVGAIGIIFLIGEVESKE